MKRLRILIAGALCLAVVALAELAARAALPRFVNFAHCYNADRNPHFMRGWPEYTAPRPRSTDEKLVIVISNSQGFLREYDNAALCYCTQLRWLLQERLAGQKCIVANWALPGAGAPELVLLAARAAQHQPDLVLLVTYGENFTDEHLEKPLSYGSTDAVQLAYDWDVRRQLPDWFLSQFHAYEFGTLTSVYSRLGRARGPLTEDPRESWTWSVFMRPRDLLEMNRKTFPWQDLSGRLLETFCDVLHAGSPQTPLLLVCMPLCKPAFHSQAWWELNRFPGRAEALLGDRPYVRIVNLITLLPPGYFITHTHMQPDGHRRLAEKLAPTVAELLGS